MADSQIPIRTLDMLAILVYVLVKCNVAAPVFVPVSSGTAGSAGLAAGSFTGSKYSCHIVFLPTMTDGGKNIDWQEYFKKTESRDGLIVLVTLPTRYTLAAFRSLKSHWTSKVNGSPCFGTVRRRAKELVMMSTLSKMAVGVVLLLALPATGGAGTVLMMLESDRPVVEAGKAQTVRVKVQVTGAALAEADRPPVNLAIVIDKSGSMQGDRISNARQGAVEAIRRLGSQDIFSVVVFDSNVKTLIPAGQLSDLGQVEEIISGIQAGGRTNIYDGMKTGLAELGKNIDRKHLNRAVLLSDGLANVGPTQPVAFDELGREFARSGVIVSTIGLGQNYNEHLLASLAQASEGNNYFVENPNLLPKLFEDEIGALVGTVATGVTITIQLPKGVALRNVLGRTHSQTGNRVEIDFHDLGSGASKYSLLELSIPAGREGDVLDAFKATARYRRASDNQNVETSASTQVRYIASRQEADAAVNLKVQHAWVELHQARVQEELLDLVERGDRQQAQARLQKLAEEAAEARIAESAARRLTSFREREERILRQRGYSRQESLSRRTDAYQLRNQQSVGRLQIDQ